MNDDRKWLVLGMYALLFLFSMWALRTGAAADERAKAAGHLADSLAEVQVGLIARAQADSAALASAQAVATRREQEIATVRTAAERRASAALRRATAAEDALRATLAAGEAPDSGTAQLDRLVAEHREVVQAKDTQIAQADSLLAVRLTLLRSTEQALASEHEARLNGDRTSETLRAQVKALNSGRRRERLVSGAVVAGVLGVLILR